MLYRKSCPHCGTGDVKLVTCDQVPEEYGSTLECIQCGWTKHDKEGSPRRIEERKKEGRAPVVLMSRYTVSEGEGYEVL